MKTENSLHFGPDPSHAREEDAQWGGATSCPRPTGIVGCVPRGLELSHGEGRIWAPSQEKTGFLLLFCLSFLTLSQKSYPLAAPPTNSVPSSPSTFSASILCFVECHSRAHTSLTLHRSHSPLTSTLEWVSCSAICSLPHFQEIPGNSGSCIPRALQEQLPYLPWC